MRAVRILVSVVLVAGFGSGCGRFTPRESRRDAPDGESAQAGDRGVDSPTTVESVPTSEAAAPSKNAPTPTPTTAPDSDATVKGESDTGEFDLSVLGDQDGRARAGIKASVTGPTAFTLTSDRDGRLRYRGPPGRYEVRIEPMCGDAIEVQTSALGRVAVAAGQTATGSLRISWRHRFAPGGPVTYEDAKNPAATAARGSRWPVGTAYVTRFAVVDRCSGKPAPSGRFSTFRFTSQPGVTVEPQQNLAADAQGYGFVRMTCTAPVDDLELVSSDAEAPHDRLDLFDRASLDDSPPSCVA